MTNSKLKLGLIFGGRSGEHAVSLMSATSVRAVIDPAKYDVYEIGITQEGQWLTGPETLSAFKQGKLDTLQEALLLNKNGQVGLYRLENGQLSLISLIDVVFPILHGTFGEDGTIQELLEFLNIPYTGSGVIASALAWDKAISKRLFVQEDIPTPPWATFTVEAFKQMGAASALDRIPEVVGAFPVVVKPAKQGSALGLTKVESAGGLAEALLTACHTATVRLSKSGLRARSLRSLSSQALAVYACCRQLRWHQSPDSLTSLPCTRQARQTTTSQRVFNEGNTLP